MTGHMNENPLKRKFNELDTYDNCGTFDNDCIFDNVDIELYSHFSKKLCIEIDENSINKDSISASKNYLMNVIKEQTIDSLLTIKNDMGSNDLLKKVYDRYINILDKFEINNIGVTLEIINFIKLYNIWNDTLQISDICTSREIMCKLFSIIINIDTYFIEYYFK